MPAKKKKLSEEINELLEMGKKRLAFRSAISGFMEMYAKYPKDKEKYLDKLLEFLDETTRNNQKVEEGEVIDADDLPF
jgi:hypothetical protein